MSLTSIAVDSLEHDASSTVALQNDAFYTTRSALDKAESVEAIAIPLTQVELEQQRFIESEFKLPGFSSLFIVIFGNALLQLSFFVIVSSASAYAEYLGGTATFSGLTIGIPTAFSGLVLIFLTRVDKGQYKFPFQIAYCGTILGNILYALAYRAQWLYLILIGRIITGLGFTAFMYSKRYCSDPRIVGVRRRTTLASWLVVGQCFGFSVGPFLGGLLYKVGFQNAVFNGFTGPGWVMAIIGVAFWIITNLLFEDIPPQQERAMEMLDSAGNQVEAELSEYATRWSDLSYRQWGVVTCMCYYAMTCFFILGSWESNIPVFSAEFLNYSPYKAGNFIAVGGIASFPFLLLNIWYARRFQDRVTLAVGTSLGLAGILLLIVLLKTDKVEFGPFLVCWFLVALGFNLASTCTLSLLSKQLPDEWNSRVSIAIQYSNYTGRVTGGVLGGAGVKLGMLNYLGVQIAVVALGGVMYLTLWRDLKAKTG